ncbi:MAG: glycosyltransferase family 2 protein [Magnetococcales bacterium]|nr:glycosyltransferase family 2 protein [Magnetococcales bacterium]NGZ26782.1 glycosyltransferase family 2 protein [Magnetococcales bacterium]
MLQANIRDIAGFSIITSIENENPDQSLDISLAIPIKDEEANIQSLYEELTQVMNNLGCEFEIIFVDDGSRDGSFAKMDAIRQQDKRVKIICFSRNFGQTAALMAAFRFSCGKVVVALDGDLQNDPADIPLMLNKLAEGYDLVNGWRKDRQDAYLTRILPSKIANAIISWLISGTHVRLHDYGCTLKVYKRDIVKNLDLYGEMHRFIPVFAAWLGAKITEMPVHHRSRKYGKPKYNLSRIVRVIFDLLVIRFFGDFLTCPMQFFGKISLFTFFLGSIYLLLVFALDYFQGWNTMAPSQLLLWLGGVGLFSLQLAFLGLLAEINIRSYFQSLRKAPFVVEKILASKNVV